MTQVRILAIDLAKRSCQGWCGSIQSCFVPVQADFKKLWTNPDTPNRERKHLLAHIIEDVTLLKPPKRGTTKVQSLQGR